MYGKGGQAACGGGVPETLAPQAIADFGFSGGARNPCPIRAGRKGSLAQEDHID